MLFFYSKRGKYYYSFRDASGTRKQISCRTADHKAAERFVERYIQQLHGLIQHEPPDKDVSTSHDEQPTASLLSDYAREYLGLIRGLAYTESSVKSNESTLRLFIKRVGDQPLATISVEQCEKFIYTSQPSLETAAKHYGHLKAIFQKAYVWGRIPENPFAKIRKPKPKEKLPEYFSREDFDLLLAQMDRSSYSSRRLIRIVVIARDTGMRLSELLNMQRSHLDTERGLIYIVVTDTFSPKSKKPRSVMMSNAVRSALLEQALEVARHPNEAVQSSPYVFPSPDGKPLSKITITHQFKAVVSQVFPDRPRLRFHSLRHSFGTMLAESNVSLARVQKLMGHSTVKMTERYARLRTDDFGDALIAINALWAGTSEQHA